MTGLSPHDLHDPSGDATSVACPGAAAIAARRRIRRILSAAGRLGLLALLLAAAWWYRHGLADVGTALRSAGGIGLGAVTAWHMLPLSLCAGAWRSLAPRGRFEQFLRGRWIREAVGDLAGFLPLSGEVTGARMLVRSRIEPELAAALTIVDVTAETLAQFAFVILGVALWLLRHPGGEVMRWTLFGLVASLPVLAAMVVMQRSRLVRFIETLPARLMPRIWQAPDDGHDTLAEIATIYGNRRRVLAALALHFGAWLAATGEAWVALRLLGHPLPVVDVVALESVIQGLRTAAFIVPGGWGVQEGAYIFVGGALGVPAETALAVSLLKRGREILLGVPGAFAWQMMEGRRRRRK